ncbi:ferritin [Alicyclobacillus shizuokensis]|uniref:ferritin n=1 Tax=Alicyclobacillus shizuokensis TaxID=392014 RepID=UPI000836C02A|nr:ferritin [Alicyclobacillus shizuokensis]
MAVSEKLMGELIRQMNEEFMNEKIYLAMSCYAASQHLEGFTKMFIYQAKEEHKHAMRFFHYIVMQGGRPRIYPTDEPQNFFDSITDCLRTAVTHEQQTTERIYHLTQLAEEEKEYSTQEFLSWFHREQVEEVHTFSDLLAQAAALDSDPATLMAWDHRIFRQYEDEQRFADDDFMGFKDYEGKPKKHRD